MTNYLLGILTGMSLTYIITFIQEEYERQQSHKRIQAYLDERYGQFHADFTDFSSSDEDAPTQPNTNKRKQGKR